MDCSNESYVKNLLYIHHPRAKRFVEAIATRVSLGREFFTAYSQNEIGIFLPDARGIVLFGRQKGILYDSPEEYLEFMELVRERGLPVAAILSKDLDGQIDKLPLGNFGVNKVIPNEYEITSPGEISESLVDFFRDRFNLSSRDRF